MKTTPMYPELYQYVLDHCDMPHDLMPRIAERTARESYAPQISSPDQAALMNLLAKLVDARKVLEIGCLTGYSAIAVASALPANGKLITIDNNPARAQIARDNFRTTGLANIIELRVGDACQELAKIESEHGASSFDMVFIDADKVPLWDYYQRSLSLLRRGGLILVDNVIWAGAVLNPTDHSESTTAIREFNQRVRNDSRVDHVMLHISDGIYILRKR